MDRRKFSDVIRIVTLDERREQFEIVRLISVELGARDREDVDDFDGVVVARGVVDGPGKLNLTSPSKVVGKRDKVRRVVFTSVFSCGLGRIRCG